MCDSSSHSSSDEDSSNQLECNECDSLQATKCEVCDEILCQKHIRGYLREWLTYDEEYCAKCRKSGCKNCMITCFSCANQGDHSDWYCEPCNDKYEILENVNCPHHLWYKCDEKHDFDQDNDCPECHSNRNYAGKMEW